MFGFFRFDLTIQFNRAIHDVVGMVTAIEMLFFFSEESLMEDLSNSESTKLIIVIGILSMTLLVFIVNALWFTLKYRYFYRASMSILLFV